MAGFGTPLSSIPNTSYSNVSSPVSSTGFTGSAVSSAKPTGMDPVTIGLSVASIGAGIFGASKQEQAAREQAQAVEDAAKTAAAATEKAAQTGAVASLRGKQAGFGYDYLTSRYEGGAGGALARVNAARDLVQKANIEANNPAFNTLRSVERYEDRLRNAMPGFMPPSALFA
jgi:hypothetical protein